MLVSLQRRRVATMARDMYWSATVCLTRWHARNCGKHYRYEACLHMAEAAALVGLCASLCGSLIAAHRQPAALLM